MIYKDKHVNRLIARVNATESALPLPLYAEVCGAVSIPLLQRELGIK